ncbi:MAG TPA: right-handed parallel beta-helix repeat-containing protein [Novosphingobium sp.]|nr:right-handed parallel beta-helix repeat-containing protein [Novosphingobium sp.]
MAGGNRSGRRQALAVFCAAGALGWGGTAQAQYRDTTFIAAEGADSGVCDIYNPCATFGYALYETVAGGNIIVLDSGNYGNAVIAKSVTIHGEGGQMTVIGALEVNAAATDKVVIDNLAFEGTYSGGGYAFGVKVDLAKDVLIQNCRFKDYDLSTDEEGGVVIAGSSGSVRLTVNNSTFFANAVGVLVESGASGTSHAKIYNSAFVSNTQAGVRVVGATNDVTLMGNVLLASPKALDLQSSGVARSYGNNVITSGDAPSALTMY